MVQAQDRSVFSDSQFVQLIQIFDPLDAPFAVADARGLIFYTNPAMKRFLRTSGRDAHDGDLCDWIAQSDLADTGLVRSGSHGIDLGALPLRGVLRLPTERGRGRATTAEMRLEAFTGQNGTPELALCFLSPLACEPGESTSALAIREWLPRIEEIGDSFDVQRLGGKVCKLLEDLLNAEAVAFYALRPTADDTLEQVWRRVEQIGRVEHIGETPYEMAPATEWLRAVERHGLVDLATLPEVVGTDKNQAAPSWTHAGKEGAILACQARGDTLGLAFVWTRGEYLARADVRHVMHLVGFQAAQGLDNTRWFELTQQAETRSRELIESANAAILAIDWQGNVTLWNRKAQTLFGRSSREVLGRPPFEFFGETPTEQKAACDQFMNALRSGDPSDEFEIHFPDSLGRTRHVIWTTSPMRSAQGAVLGLYAIGQDVTERRNLEAQMLQAQKNESIGTLARGVAHDYNNILNGINGFLYLVKTNGHEKDKVDKYLTAIKDLTTRASGLTRQLQAYARQSRPAKARVDLNELLRQTIDLLKVGAPRTVKVTLDLAEGLDWIEADRSQVEQVFMNLCLNAVEAMPKGGTIFVHSDLYNHAPDDEGADAVDLKPGRYCRVRVLDTGCGMPNEVRLRVFDPFFTTKKTGNGLGLAAVYGIVEGHGGVITVESEPGHGTTFCVYLPALEERGESVGDGSMALRGGNETVLVVDDEPAIRLMAEDILGSLGYRVVLAEDGEEAVRIFQERPDAIQIAVMDIAMPRLNGRAAAKAMRMIRPDLRVLFTSGFSDRAQVASLSEDGFGHFLPKPYAMIELQAAVRAALDARDSRQT